MKMKKISILLLLVALFSCFAIGLTSVLATSKADAAVTLNSFVTNDGAMIRADSITGLRFTASISKDDYLAVKTADNDAEFGMAIARTNNLDELKSFISDAELSQKVHFPMTENAWNDGASPNTAEATEYRYSFTINNIDEENYAVNYTAMAYVKINGSYVYSTVSSNTASTRSPLIVSIGFVGVTQLSDTFAHDIISYCKPQIAFNQTKYTVDGNVQVKPIVKLGDVELNLVINSSDTDVVSIDENGILVAHKVGSAKLTASVKGAGQDVFTAQADVVVQENNVTPTVSADGILTLGTNGEATTVTVNDGTANIITENLTAGTTTFDLYDAIIDYRETNSKHTSKSYIVTVDSASYHGSVNTVSIGAISDLAGLKAAVDAQSGAAEADCKINTTYYYLTGDITLDADSNYGTGYSLRVMANSSAKNTSNQTLWNHINLDGRGYSFKFAYNNTGAGSRLIFSRLYESNIKNLVVDYSGNFGHINDGSFAYGIDDSVLTNCYFKLSINAVAGTKSKDSPLTTFMQNATFNNCIFELIDQDDDSYGMSLQGGTTNCTESTLNNCAIIYDKAEVTVASLFKHTDVEHTFINTNVYANVETFIGTADNYSAFDNTAWTINDICIALCGKNIVYFNKLEAIPTLSAIGELTLNTNGEATTVTVNDGESNIITENLTAGTTTFDLYDAIIAYREANSNHTAKSYTVTVESVTRIGTTTTGEIIAISTLDEMVAQAKASTKDSGKYYYLTSDINIIEGHGTYDKSGYCYFIHNSNNAIYMNIDGRGHSLTLHSVKLATQAKRIMFYRVDESHFKNIIFDTDIEGMAHNDGILATYAHNNTFENCYFNVSMNNLSEITEPQAMIRNDGRNVYKNCVFQLVDANLDDGYDIILSGRPDTGTKQTYDNCAVITTNVHASELFASGNEPSYENGTKLYSTVSELAFDWATNGTVSSSWLLDENSQEIKFFDKTVLSYQTVSAVKGSPTVDGIVSFVDTVKSINVDLYNAQNEYITTLEQSYFGETYDLYKAIADYRIANSITANEKYVVKFYSSGYYYEFETATIGAISNLAGLKAAVDAQSGAAEADCKIDTTYYYLTGDITLDADSNYGTGYSLRVMANSSAKNTSNQTLWNHINLDGRGYSFKFAYNNTGAGSRLIFSRLYESNIKNLVVDYSGNFGHINDGSFAYGIDDSVLTNCYFKLSINAVAGTKSKDSPLTTFMQNATFNNCIFELIDQDDDSYGMSLQGGTTNCTASTLNNCAIIYDKAEVTVASLFKHTDIEHTFTNTNVYANVENLVNAEKDDLTWNSELKITNQGISLFGKTITAVEIPVAEQDNDKNFNDITYDGAPTVTVNGEVVEYSDTGVAISVPSMSVSDSNYSSYYLSKYIYVTYPDGNSVRLSTGTATTFTPTQTGEHVLVYFAQNSSTGKTTLKRYIITVGEQEATATETDEYLVKNSVAEYKIVISNEASYYEYYAAKELKYYLDRATSSNFEIITDNGMCFNGKAKLISVGRTEVLSGSNVDVSYDDLKSDGFIIKRCGNTLILCGGDDYGTLYSVYEFLYQQIGWEAYGPDEIVYREASSLKLLDFDFNDKPAIEYRQGGYYIAQTDAELAAKWRTWAGQGKMLDGDEAWYRFPHALFAIAGPDKYGENEGWFSEKDKAQPCFTSEGYKQQFITNLKALILSHIDQDLGTFFYPIGIEDVPNKICGCPNCTAEINAYKVSGMLVRWTNSVTEEIIRWKNELGITEEIYIPYLAYYETLEPPTNSNGEPIDNSVILSEYSPLIFAPIEAANDRPYTHELNAEFFEMYRNWEKCSSSVMGYLYTGSFSRSFEWSDIIYAHTENLKILAESGAIYVLDDSGNSVYQSMAFQQMYGYVYSKLKWNPYQDTNELVREYMQNYYKEASDYVSEYYYLMKMQVAQALEDKSWRFISEEEDFWLKQGVVEQGYQLLVRAKQVIQNSSNYTDEQKSVYIARIEREMLTPLFYILENFSNSYSSNEYLARLEVMEDICSRHSVTTIKSGMTNDEVFSAWEAKVN